MRLICLLQLYVPYVLPRGTGWDTAQLSTSLDGLDVVVRPRGPSEALFPNEIDRTLSTTSLQLQRLSLPVSAVQVSVRDYAFDRIEIQVSGKVEDVNTGRQETEERFLKTAVAVVNTVLQHLRVLTRASFLTGLQEHYRLQDGKRYFLFPRTLSWFNGETSERFPFYGEVNGSAATGAVRSPEQGNVPFSALVQSLRSGPPSLERSLLVDAEERLVTLRLREAIVSLSMACEVSSNQFLHRKGVSSNPQVVKILKSKDSFARKRFDKIPSLLGLPSLLVEDSVTFDLIEQLYRARNSVAHTATLEFEHNGAKITVDETLATRMQEAATKAISWLEDQ